LGIQTKRLCSEPGLEGDARFQVKRVSPDRRGNDAAFSPRAAAAAFFCLGRSAKTIRRQGKALYAGAAWQLRCASGARWNRRVELTAKVLGEDGKIVDAKTFRASAPAKGTDAPAAAGALNDAFRQTAAALVAWTAAATSHQ
jgi:hypothetical protein